jgi:hypothetical protein
MRIEEINSNNEIEVKGLKKKFLDRIEKHSVKSTLEGETVYLKKSSIPLIGDWSRIYPAVNEDGSWNITNLIFGGRRNFIKLLLFLALIGLVILGFYEIISSFNATMSQPCIKSCIDAAKNLNNLGVLP